MRLFDNESDSTHTDGFIVKANSDGCDHDPNVNTSTYHIIILEHGMVGNRKELEYLKEALEHAHTRSTEKKGSVLLVHSAECNEKDSLDGIEAGGHRFANEINDVVRRVATGIVREHLQRQQCSRLRPKKAIESTNITLSIIGNSLGGLFARFAVRYIDWMVPIDLGSTSPIIEIHVIPNLFVTIATPHLGIKDMTYFKVPEFLERLAAWTFGQTGNDLFRRGNLKKKKSKIFAIKSDSEAHSKSNEVQQIKYNDIIEELCLNPEFIRPLSRFSRRIAYANAFSSDIAVSTATGAFLADDDDDDDSYNYNNNSGTSNPQDSFSILSQGQVSMRSSHIFVPGIDVREKEISNRHIEQTRNSHNNKTQYSSARFDTATTYCNTDREPLTRNPPTVSDMANKLDSLGWSKVFIDARPHLPAIWKRPDTQRQASQNSFAEYIGRGGNGDLDANQIGTSCYSSGELKRRLSGNGFDGTTLPLGHGFLVANTKDPIHKMLYTSARPFVDQIIVNGVMTELLLFVPP